VPAGEFMMGSPANEEGRRGNESPQHKVKIARAFAVSRFEVTFDEWDACVARGGCAYQPVDHGWGRGRRPVIEVSWEEAQRYAAWLSKQTGKPYRLLSEAEWEYAARAGSDKAFSWGDKIGEGNANCNGCGSKWDNRETSPVGAFKPNAFGLDDMAGNVWEWVQDCSQDNYTGAPTDGSAWESGGCTLRVLRGGSFDFEPPAVRSAERRTNTADYKDKTMGFRLARTLSP
jgi:formylglycine-generating enzyme required for sulfatase activity